MKPLRIAAFAAGLCAAAAGFAAAPAQPAVAVLEPTLGHDVRGKAAFQVIEDGRVRVSVALVGLEPNSVHGLAIHERGDCAMHAVGAGGHFDPYGARRNEAAGTPRA